MKNTVSNPWTIFILIALSLALNIGWSQIAGFVRDDAYITFRYAENIAEGNGFVFNPGERIYGTSTPAMTLLLAGWVKMGGEVLAGAFSIDAIAAALSLLFLWWIFDYYQVATRNRIALFILLIWSDKMIINLMEGMEVSLVICAMMASYYFFMVRQSPVLAGLACAFMLWVRIDSALWVVALALGAFLWSDHFFSYRRMALTIVGVAGMAYTPWLVFSFLYFGSIIPHTVIAKRVAYGVNIAPWHERFQTLFKWLSPFTTDNFPTLGIALAVITIALALYALWYHRGILFVQVLGIFFFIQSMALVTFNMTFEKRYFMPVLYVVLILCGIGLSLLFADISRKISVGGYAANIRPYFIGVYMFAALFFSFPNLQHWYNYQKFVYPSHIKMGQWIEENTPWDATIYLEPLGYTGYYANRVMWDDVGLVTPSVLALKRQGMTPYEAANVLKPDYVVLHCDDAKKAPEGYSYPVLAVRFDPLGFVDGKEYPDWIVQRNACYEIHTAGPGKVTQ